MNKLLNSQLILNSHLHAPVPQRAFPQLICTRIQSSIEISQQNRIEFNELQEVRKQSSNPPLREDLYLKEVQRECEENSPSDVINNTEESNDLENEQLFFDNLSFDENEIQYDK